ncbi:MAG: Gluconolactonase [Pedosphaera sp.]|nr:Gluconolactonase [Pedosphaera sp.]
MKKIIVLALAFVVQQTGVFAADFDVRNAEEFQKIVPAGASLTKLGGGMKFVEGPVWVPWHGGFLIFSDIPTAELKKWSAKEGVVTFREHSNKANGNCLDRKNCLLSCEGGARRVTLTSDKGEIQTVVEQFEGKKFNSPNDVVVKSDRTIWFSDPDYELGGRPREVEGMCVYRFDPKTKGITSVVKDCDHPNGLCFSPDEKRLYVADSGSPHNIHVYDVLKDGTLTGGRVFCVIDKGGPDGIRCDTAGRLFSSAGDGVHIFDPQGSLIGKILVPETPANLCFGGDDGKTLFITARTSLYSIHISVSGAK